MPTPRHLLALPLAFVLLAAPGVALAFHDVIISEYEEDTVFNKALEFYNATPNTIDLGAGNYQVWIYANGSAAATTTINLTGSIPGGGTYVLTHSSATAALLALADQTSANLSFNGDDAVALVKVSTATTLDVIGQIGVDPGTEWGVGLTSTADNDLRRNVSICDGDVNGGDAFDPSVEWTGLSTDNFLDIGQHGAVCSLVGVPEFETASRMVLFAPRPNPLASQSELVFELAAPGRVRLEILDIAGRRVRTLVAGALDPGTHRAAWNGRDDSGRRAPNGLYVVRLESASGVRLQRLVVLSR